MTNKIHERLSATLSQIEQDQKTEIEQAMKENYSSVVVPRCVEIDKSVEELLQRSKDLVNSQISKITSTANAQIEEISAKRDANIEALIADFKNQEQKYREEAESKKEKFIDEQQNFIKSKTEKEYNDVIKLLKVQLGV